MSEYEALLQTLALTAGVGWASGINLYATIAALGIAGATGNADLPASLAVVQDPLVISAAAIMYCIEFVADKIPGFDSIWDGLHTFIRIPAGALLATAAVGDVTPALAVAAGIGGGVLSTTTHAAKSGTRALINTSPEPFTNWGASVTEDLSVFGGMWLAFSHPLQFLFVFVLFVVVLIWAMPKLWRSIRNVWRRVGRWLGLVRAS